MQLLGIKLPLLAAMATLLTLPSALTAATAEVTLSGSTWTGKVDGVTKYTGTSMSAAVYACSSVMGSGTIQVKNSGSTGEMRIFGNQILDGWGGPSPARAPAASSRPRTPAPPAPKT